MSLDNETSITFENPQILEDACNSLPIFKAAFDRFVNNTLTESATEGYKKQYENFRSLSLETLEHTKRIIRHAQEIRPLLMAMSPNPSEQDLDDFRSSKDELIQTAMTMKTQSNDFKIRFKLIATFLATYKEEFQNAITKIKEISLNAELEGDQAKTAIKENALIGVVTLITSYFLGGPIIGFIGSILAGALFGNANEFNNEKNFTDKYKQMMESLSDQVSKLEGDLVIASKGVAVFGKFWDEMEVYLECIEKSYQVISSNQEIIPRPNMLYIKSAITKWETIEKNCRTYSNVVPLIIN